ncbi:prepilin-type N-terminal cleavage/methylation domain-containing protein [Chamaesiphon sp. VAR_48_metabat_135_sub]|uniref:prepilin-type N-terminal cleavage/methylation domain-containing protein n=1 Tax=Chamaesiphon sp. VAR_48_metabat_135_sub TaxID=2964699 RepID=UPI00286A14E7|nr:prepilin-type N-terminal cleavage/methylation domain-containing protein [Chamaesiphon sp. VAR_48_metabat_135_sub]
MRFKIQDRDCAERGFTLIELLVALVITGIVIGLTGSGLYALMNANQRSQIETTDRLELGQALAFMTDEIKMSQQVMTNIPSPYTGITSFNPASGSSRIQPILVLNPAPNSGLTNPIVYYLADPPNSSVWLGPRVIYRWGPTLLQNGNYSDGNGLDVSQIPSGSPVAYYNEVLVDRISDGVADQANIACETSYSYAAPSILDRLGFYACIAPDQKSVKLWMYKQPNPSAKSQSVNALVVTRSN